jgi:hypothetical protein
VSSRAHSDVYGNFFNDGGFPKCRDEVVGRIEEKLRAHLSRLGKGAPRLPASERTVAATLKSIAEFQGAFFQGSSTDAMDEVVVRVRDLVLKLETETKTSAGECAVSPAAVAVRPSAEQQDDRAQPSASQGRLPVIEGFFCKKIPDKKQLLRDLEAVERADDADKDERWTQLKAQLMALETIDVHKEAQVLMSSLSGGRRVFEMHVHPQPSFDTFKSQMRSAKERNVRLLHLAGHGESRCGFFWLKDQAVSTEYEEVSLDTFIGILKTELAGANGGTIECVVLNACDTEDMGKKLRSAGASHVVCWRSEVQDDTAREFALQFYASLNEQDPTQLRDYPRAFQHAVARIGSGGGAARAKAKHLAVGAVDYVCLLSESGDRFPDTGHIRQGQDGDSDSRQFGPPKDKEHWAALAGQQELLMLRELGFDTSRMQPGQGLDERGFATAQVMWQSWGVANYAQMWGRHGKAVLRRSDSEPWASWRESVVYWYSI